MSSTIGLAIASDELRAVVVRDGAVQWAGRAGRTDEPALSVQLAALLAQAPRSRWARPRVIAAVGPGAAQLKRLTGLPALQDRTALDALVRESMSRFFLKNGIPLVTTGVRAVEAGTVWAAAFEQPVVSEIARGCRAARCTLRMIVPAVDALRNVLRDGRAMWGDGDVLAEAEFAGGALLSVRRLPRDDASEHGEPPRVAQPLVALGEDGWRFADAYGAAVSAIAEPLAFRPDGQGEEAAARRRLRMAAASAVFAATLAIASPALSAIVDGARASRELRQLAPHARDAARIEQELQRMSRALGEVGAFAASSRSPTLLLAGLAHALPPGAALVVLRMDSAGGTLVLLAPRAARAIAALDSVPGIAAPEIVGPVTQEVIGTRQLERATVRFRLLPGGAR